MKQLYTSNNEGTAPRIFTLALCEGELSTLCTGQSLGIGCTESWPSQHWTLNTPIGDGHYTFYHCSLLMPKDGTPVMFQFLLQMTQIMK